MSSPSESDTLPRDPFIIRPATAGDAKVILNLMAEHAEYEGDDSFSKTGKVKLLKKFLAQPDCPFECLVVEADGIVQGYSTFLPQFDTWLCAEFLLLDALFLRPSLRGLGAGKKLMARVRKRAKELNCSSMRWQTPAFNKLGIGFYTKLKAHSTKTVFFHWDLD